MEHRRRTANGTRTRYKYPSKTELGQEQLKPDRTRRRSARYLVCRHIIDGDTREEIIDAIMERYGYSESSAGDIYNEAQRTMAKKAENLAEKVAEKNHLRLEEIIEVEMENGNSKIAIDAIDKQNKMCNLYEQKINVKTDEPVEIKFG